LVNLRFFDSPYFDHEAFMHQALHVLDAPGFAYPRTGYNYNVKSLLTKIHTFE